MTDSEFLARVERFLRVNRMAASRLGKDALNDPSFVLKLRRGRTTTLERVNRVLQFMNAQKRARAA